MKTLRIGCKSFSKGFTLLELIIVIAILGLLAAVVIPEYQKRNSHNLVKPAVFQPPKAVPVQILEVPYEVYQSLNSYLNRLYPNSSQVKTYCDKEPVSQGRFACTATFSFNSEVKEVKAECSSVSCR